MSEYGNDFISITDDDGKEYILEHIDTIELEGECFMSFLPADMDEDDEDFGVVYLKVVNEITGEFLLLTDEEIEKVHPIFIQRIIEAEEAEEEE